MSGKLYLRKIRLTFMGGSGLVVNPGGLADPDQLYVEFAVSKDISSNQNDGTIRIWNLAEGSRNAVGRELKDVKIEAGYMPPDGGPTFGEVAFGQIRDVEHERDGPDIITTVTLGEGDRAIRKATISKTIPAGTKVKDIVETLYDELEKQGVKRGEWKFPEGFEELTRKRPVTMHGDVKAELDNLGRSHGFYASIQGENVEIVGAEQSLGGVIELSKDTGLKGVPSITDGGVRASALFNPAIRPGRRVKIISETLEMNSADNLYRVASADYAGSNRTGDHHVAFVGNRMGADGKVEDQVE